MGIGLGGPRAYDWAVRLILPEGQRRRGGSRFGWTILAMGGLLLLAYLAGPREIYYELNTATWELRMSRSLWGLTRHTETISRSLDLWAFDFDDETPWLLGPLHYLLGAEAWDGEWACVARYNEGWLKPRPDFPEYKGDYSVYFEYMLMQDGLLEMCLQGAYGGRNPPIGEPTPEASRRMAENARDLYRRGQNPMEVSNYLAYVYEHSLWADPATKAWRKNIGFPRALEASEVPTLAEYDARPPVFGAQDYLTWWEH